MDDAPGVRAGCCAHLENGGECVNCPNRDIRAELKDLRERFAVETAVRPVSLSENVVKRRQFVRNNVTGNIDTVADWHSLCTQKEKREDDWLVSLQSIGMKAVHPDDGWVDRYSSTDFDYVCLQFPYFSDDPQPGDLIALGGPDQYRVRRVLAVEEGGLFWQGKRYQIYK